jgi:DNA primase
MIPNTAQPDTVELRDNQEKYGFQKNLGKVKDEVPLPTYAATVTNLRQVGIRLVGSCPNPGHNDGSPSFTIYEESDTWYCFGCLRGGDILDLFMCVEGWPEDAYGPALPALAERFNVVLWERPPRWLERQDEKVQTREAAKRHLASVYQRRLTRVFAPLVLLGGETPEEELEALEGLASSLWPVSLSMADRRVFGEG